MFSDYSGEETVASDVTHDDRLKAHSSRCSGKWGHLVSSLSPQHLFLFSVKVLVGASESLTTETHHYLGHPHLLEVLLGYSNAQRVFHSGDMLIVMLTVLAGTASYEYEYWVLQFSRTQDFLYCKGAWMCLCRLWTSLNTVSC